jgi:signal transduction histidine kinase
MAEAGEGVEAEAPRGEEIGAVIHYMMVLNPSIEIYILDRQGRILAFFAEPGREVGQERVDLRPIRAFLQERRPLPILGDDPRRPGQRKHFSAAPLDLGGGRRGYLYIVLESSRYAEARAELEYSYLSRALLQSALMALPLVGLLGLALFFLFTRRLQELTRIVRSFGKGDYSARAPVRSRDEIGELAGSFNEMANTIEESHRRLEKADRQRRELTAGVSHDLRTPLSTIRGYTETLLEKEDGLTREERRRYLEIIRGRTEALGRLVKDLFELATLEARDETPAGERFSLSELVHDTVMQLQVEAEKREIALAVREPESLFFCDGDVGMIERALSNLIRNALEHTPAGGRVELTIDEVQDGVRVAVSDNGEGIPAEELAGIFDRFVRRAPRRRGAAARSGLGLAIARRIVELHGGRVDARSTPGRGSTFFFELPLAPGEAERPQDGEE